MTEAIRDIERWGNNLDVRLPAAVAEGRVTITAQGDEPPTLADRLAVFDPSVHGGQALAVVPLGREAC